MKNLNLEVTKEEAELIIGALQELPFKMTNLLIGKVVEQCNEQLQEIPQMEGTSEELEAL